MTTPTPAQQLEEVVCELGRFTRAGPHDAAAFVLEHAPTLRRALAALEAVEAGELLTPDYRGWITAHSENVTRQWLIIPADAVEVSRGE